MTLRDRQSGLILLGEGNRNVAKLVCSLECAIARFSARQRLRHFWLRRAVWLTK
jgi:hypothetical protein